MISILIAIFWILGGLVCAGVMLYLAEWDHNDAMLATFIGLTCWPVLIVIGLCFGFVKLVTIFPLMIARFLDSLFKR